MRVSAAWLLISCLGMAAAVQGITTGTGRSVPPTGSRVRITSEKLGRGWHVGMLNRIRTEPVCYRVLIFAPPNRIKRIIDPDDITKIQVSSIYNKGGSNYDPAKWEYPREKWLDVSLDDILAANKKCPEKQTRKP